MSLSEFQLIQRYFLRPPQRAAVGVGDDCALLVPRPGWQLAVSTDMLVEGRHFLPGTDARHLGHKALAVNLSDLAACGAEPLGFTLALALPGADGPWLQAFSEGLLALADRHGCELVGGDTTAGPLNICITVLGEVPADTALLRSGARPGDELWVSGHLGDARLALEALLERMPLAGTALDAVRAALEQPVPRLALGRALRGVASAAIDLSDGLSGDLRHVLELSGVDATVHLDALPRSATLAAQAEDVQQRCLLSGGDDYELLFTAAPGQRARVLEAARQADVPVHCIGHIAARGEASAPQLRVLNAQGQPISGDWPAWDHFRKDTSQA